MLPLVRAFDWRAVDAGLREKPQLVQHRDDRGRNWLHVCCATPLDGRDPDRAFARRTCCWPRHRFSGSRFHGRTLASDASLVLRGVWAESHLAEHLMKLGERAVFALRGRVQPRHRAIRLLVRYGADIEEPSGPGQTPFLGAMGWSHFEAAEAMLACGANVNAQDDRGMTAAHMMLKKGSDYEYFELLARHGPASICPTNTA